MATVERGFLLLADLTGYTSYLARGELAHAPVIAGDLLETVVGRLEPPFRLAKLEGDAAFLFAEEGRAEPALLLDAIVASYLAFRRRLRSIEAASACDCKACALAPRLDLKAFVHYGDYLRSTIAGRDELSGADVIVAHRLLKGAGAASAAGRGFVLFTVAAAEALGLDHRTGTLVAGSESIEHLGDVATLTLDLEERWTAETAARRVTDTAGTPLFAITVDLDAAPADVWAQLTSPDAASRLGGPARDHGDAGRRDARRRGDRALRHRPAGHDRGDRGLGAVRARRPARRRAGHRRGRDEPRPRGGRAAGRGSLSAGGAHMPPADAAAAEMARHDTEAALGRLRQVMGRGIAVLQGAEVTR